MKRNSFIILIVITVVCLIGFNLALELYYPKCAKYGCDSKAAEGSAYCSLHRNGQSNTVRSNSVNVQSQNKSGGSAYGSGSKYYSPTSAPAPRKSSAPSSYTRGGSSSGKSSYSSSRYKDGYDDGYDDVYSDGEPDWDRYDTDDDYARGADDALDEYEEYGEDW